MAGRSESVRAITAVGSWTRPRSYFTRSRWAGKRTLDGVDVVDGVATNALSHAIVTAMRVAGVHRARDVARVEVDAFRANDTESDDTTVVRVRRQGREPDLTCALTLCGPEEAEPYVTVHGSRGTATFFYVLDEVRVVDATGEHVEHFGRDDLLENLLDARAGHGDLLSALADTEAYMTVLEAVRTGPAPRLIPRRVRRPRGFRGRRAADRPGNRSGTWCARRRRRPPSASSGFRGRSTLRRTVMSGTRAW